MGELILLEENKHPREHRSIFIKKFSEVNEIHGHLGSPCYPKVQFKNFNGRSYCLNLLDTHLDTGGTSFKVPTRFSVSTDINMYRFLVPYIPDKKGDVFIDFNKRLRNNLCYIIRQMGQSVDSNVLVNVQHFQQQGIKVKMSGFNLYTKGYFGTFKSNLVIPDYIGIGKHTNIGFGTVERIK